MPDNSIPKNSAEEPTGPFQTRFILNPIYWPTWLGIGLLYLCTLLPYSWMLSLGTTLGWLGYNILPGRRRITRANLRMVFPDYDKKQINQITRESFYSAGIALLESAWAWWVSDRKLKPLRHVEGLEHLQAAEKLGKGVLLLGGHYTTLEISGRLLAYHADNVFPTYKPARNPLFEAMMTHNRRRMNKGLVASRDMRSIIKLLKQKQIIWYAPDQDFGIKRSVFASFMGVQTATLTMSTRLAKISKAPVVPFYSKRLPGNQGYKISFAPMLENFPGTDEASDARAVNAAIEKHVYDVPGQYLWGHRRFKTRPWGQPQAYKPKRDKYIRRYTLAHCLLSLPVIAYSTWLAIKNKQLRYLLERITFINSRPADLIIHAASIGEVNAVAPLVNRILEEKPSLKILFTINTPSGRNAAEKLFGNKVNYRYMPLDWHWLINRYLTRVNPGCSLIMETETWLNYFEYCFYKGITNIIVNARLSERSINAPYTVRYWINTAIHYATHILARSQVDADRYLAFNAQAEHVSLIGNIKYAAKPPTEIKATGVTRPFVLLASSRNGEEKLIVSTWLSLKGEKPLLVIVPRHIQRINEIISDLQGLTKKIAVRSRQDIVGKDTEVYIADTFGELTGFIHESLFVIMGGSFEPYGGQNIIEVGQASKAVIFGPNMKNFHMEAEQFVEADAAIQVADQQALSKKLGALLEDPEIAKRLGENGKNLVESHEHIIDDYIRELKKHCTLLKG